jgi:hypothetical protein
MGGLAHVWGLEKAFYMVGAAGIAITFIAAGLGRGVETPKL